MYASKGRIPSSGSRPAGLSLDDPVHRTGRNEADSLGKRSPHPMVSLISFTKREHCSCRFENGMRRSNRSWQEKHSSYPNRSLTPALGKWVTKMSGTILVGVNREIRSVPDGSFVQSIEGLPAKMASRLAFMTDNHHMVRDFVVREMPRQLRPLSPQDIVMVTGLDLRKVSVILQDLERNLFFLVRNSEGNVNWAFPVTTSLTPHKLSFSMGENIFGA
jgi:hypothetical protein